jgi:hypothetical protein
MLKLVGKFKKDLKHNQEEKEDFECENLEIKQAKCQQLRLRKISQNAYQILVKDISD